MMRKQVVLFAMAILLMVACKKSEDPMPIETKAVINGAMFNPGLSDAKKLGSKLIISFVDGTKKRAGY